MSFAKANWIWQGLDRGQLYDSYQIHCLPGREREREHNQLVEVVVVQGSVVQGSVPSLTVRH